MIVNAINIFIQFCTSIMLYIMIQKTCEFEAYIFFYLLNAFNLRRIHLQSEDYIYGFIYKITTTVHIRKGNHKRYIPKENHIHKKNQQDTQARNTKIVGPRRALQKKNLKEI